MRRFAAVALVLGACGEATPEEPRTPSPPRTEPAAAMTPEELAETRRKAGFLDGAALAEERAAAREQVARAYVRSRLEEHREVVKALGRSVDEIDRAAKRWLRAGDRQRAYERWRGGFHRRAERVAAAYRRLQEPGVDGGRTEALLAQVFRGWEDLKEDLGGDVAGDPRFVRLVAEIRTGLAAVSAALDDIQHDEALAAG